MNSHNIKMNVEAQIFDKKGNLKRSYGVKNPNGDAVLRLTQLDKDGNVKRQTEQPMKSFVSNFARVLNYAFLTVDNSTSGSSIDKIIEAVTGGATYLASASHLMAVNEAALTASAQTAYGIWIGDKNNKSGLGLTQESGINSAEAYDDYMLRTLMLADGGSPDTGIEYRAVNITLSGNDITISRRFQNDSAISVYIDEIGLVAKSGSDYFLIARDKITYSAGGESPVIDYEYEIPTTDIFVVEYVFSVSDLSGFTKNYLRMIDSCFRAGNASSNPRDINGNYYVVNFTSARTQMDLLAAANADTHGIVLGGATETNYSDEDPDALSADSYKLSLAKLLDSEIDYGAVTAIALTQESDSFNYTQFGMYRDFENTGSERIHIQETALYMKEAAATHYYMIARAVLDHIIVDPQEILRINVKFQFPLNNTDPIVTP